MNGCEEDKAVWFTALENAKQAWNVCKVNNGLRLKKNTTKQTNKEKKHPKQMTHSTNQNLNNCL